jgi:hypothetical protein
MELKTLKRKASDSKHGAWSPFESSMVLGSKEVRERLLDSGGTSGGVSVNDLCHWRSDCHGREDALGVPSSAGEAVTKFAWGKPRYAADDKILDKL